MPLYDKPDLARRRRLGLRLVLPWLMAAMVSQGAPKQWSLELRQIAPLESMRQAAQAAGMDLDGLDLPAMRETLQAGDQVTALITLNEGKKLKQWAVELTADELTAEEKARLEPEIKLHTSTGREYVFGGGRAALKIRIIGPLEASDAGRKMATRPNVQARRITVRADYLVLGLDGVAALQQRINAARQAVPGVKPLEFHIGNRPFPVSVIAQNRRVGGPSPVDMTEAEERTFGGGMLAMHEFFGTASRTPGLQEVLASVLDVPWLALLRKGGKLADINLTSMPVVIDFDGLQWGLSAVDKLRGQPWLLQLNGKPALLILLAVTAPRPPLAASAGVVALAAGRPNGKGPLLTLQVVSSRSAEAKSR